MSYVDTENAQLNGKIHLGINKFYVTSYIYMAKQIQIYKTSERGRRKKTYASCYNTLDTCKSFSG